MHSEITLLGFFDFVSLPGTDLNGIKDEKLAYYIICREKDSFKKYFHRTSAMVLLTGLVTVFIFCFLFFFYGGGSRARLLSPKNSLLRVPQQVIIIHKRLKGNTGRRHFLQQPANCGQTPAASTLYFQDATSDEKHLDILLKTTCTQCYRVPFSF